MRAARRAAETAEEAEEAAAEEEELLLGCIAHPYESYMALRVLNCLLQHPRCPFHLRGGGAQLGERERGASAEGSLLHRCLIGHRRAKAGPGRGFVRVLTIFMTILNRM